MRGVVLGALVLLAIGVGVYVLRSRPVSEIPAALGVDRMTERITVRTTDGVMIIGDFYAPSQPSARGLLLLHMMPATRSSWREFAGLMQQRGWQVLAIDLRGHGESEGGPDGYKDFSDTEHQSSRLDVEAAAAWLQSKGVTALALAGASIGANLALQYLAAHPEARAAVLLSPGLDYRGVTTEDATRSLRPTQRVLYVAAKDDAASADAVATLGAATPQEVDWEVNVFPEGGHGTTLFERKPELLPIVVDWFDG